MKESYEVDMCSGSLLDKILLLSVSLVVSGIPQFLFNTADIIVMGRFTGSSVLATVGFTSASINLLVSVPVNLSVDADVLAARYCGGRKEENMGKTTHVTVTASVLNGLFLVTLNLMTTRPLLHLVGTSDDVLSQSVLRMRVYFLRMPVLILYNFGIVILGATRDTRCPLYFLSVAGIANVVLNLFFVIGLGMEVNDVTWVTVIFKHILALLVLKGLMETPGALKLSLKNLRTHPKKLKRVIRIRLPAGVQKAIFSISSVLIQSLVNSFGSIAIARNTVSSNIGGLVYTAMNTVYQINLSSTSQNLGGRKYSKVSKIMYICLGVITEAGLSLGLMAILGSRMLLGIYSSDPEVLRYGTLRPGITCTTYFLYGIMSYMVGSPRDLGYSIIPTFVPLTGTCGFRALWVFIIFVAYHSLDALYLSCPVPWIITTTTYMIAFCRIHHRIPKQDVVPMIQMPIKDTKGR